MVSLPRSGSTLIEQILASHSHVDASYELSEINSIAVELENLQIKSNVPYKLNSLTQEHLATLAKRYLKFIEPFRNNKPYFIDKQPVNFQHIALIKTLFPNAKIIDVQRDKKRLHGAFISTHFHKAIVIATIRRFSSLHE
ncbi:sulfotransferase [Pseudoalteromonas sp. B193]